MPDTSTVIVFLQESLFLILVYGAFLGFAMFRSTQSLINLTLGLYLAFLISIKFPYYDLILGSTGGNATTESITMILVFAAFTTASTLLFGRLMIGGGDEPAFDNFSNKLLYAGGATILIMIYSYHVLPIADLVHPGTPIQYLFASEASFFWWLLAPLLLLFLL